MWYSLGTYGGVVGPCFAPPSFLHLVLFRVQSLTDQLNEVTETAKSLKTRESLARLHYIQKDKELKDMIVSVLLDFGL